MKRIVLVTGGCRSGKSRYALEIAASYRHKAFIATAESLDDEMRARIERHRRQRRSSFYTVEEPLQPAEALRQLPQSMEMAVLDCITVWLGNLFHHGRIGKGASPEIEDFLALLRNPPCHLVLVTNEVGMGIVPADPLARAFRDLAGRINQQLASVARQVVLMVSGLPLQIK